MRVEVEVVYWHDAFHIHQWFMDNCKDGGVSREDINKLIKQCERVMEDPSLIVEMRLPKWVGKYGNWWMSDIELTVTRLNQVKEHMGPEWEFEYRWM